jgi:ubiquinone/menaquinone biosynthesis C-methylase UbiE
MTKSNAASKTTLTGAMDSINQRTMSTAVDDYQAIVDEGLNAQELAALASVGPELCGSRILDLGIGAGRTVAPLLAVSQLYTGVDYVQEMVDHCRTKFPSVRFEKADARDMKVFPDESFDLVFFSCNGICMVDHSGRIAILKEVRRVLSAGGTFVFTTCNRNSPQYEAVFRFPPFLGTINPAKWLVRAVRFALETAHRVRNRLRFRKHEVRTGEFSIVNDVCHHYSTMLYFIGLRGQVRQLEIAGFAPLQAYDLAGRPADDRCRDGTIAFVSKKPA